MSGRKKSVSARWIDYPWVELVAVAGGLLAQLFLLQETKLVMDNTFASMGFAVVLILGAFSVASLNRFSPMQRSGDDATFITMSILASVVSAALIAGATFIPLLTLPAFAMWAVIIFRSARVAALGKRMNTRHAKELEWKRSERPSAAPALHGRRRAV